MTRSRGWLGAIFVAGALAGSLAVQYASQVDGPEIAVASAQGIDTRVVAVQRGDVVASLGLTGEVVAQSVIDYESDVAGMLEQQKFGAGTLIERGTALGTVGGVEILAPADATLVEWLVPDGAKVQENLPIIRLRLIGFAIEAAVDSSNAYLVLIGADVHGRSSIDQGPGPFDCVDVVTPAEPAPDESGGAANANSFRPVLCLVPDDVRSIVGVPAVMQLQSARAEGVLLLPVEAVTGSVESGEVELVDGDRRTRRSVTLGVTDGISVEITSGLNDGDTVAATGPRLKIES